MYLSTIIGFLSVSMVIAGGSLKLVKMRYKIKDDGQLMKQDVGLNFQENFLKIKSPALDGKTPAMGIYFPAKRITQYRQADHCFLLSPGFEEIFSTNMDDWWEKDDGEKVMRAEDFVFYNYTAAPFCIDREKIPLVMQEDCDEIYPAILVNTVRGQRAYGIMKDEISPFVTKFYGPVQQHRNEYRSGRTGRYKKRDDLLRKIFGSIGAGIGAFGNVLAAALQ